MAARATAALTGIVLTVAPPITGDTAGLLRAAVFVASVTVLCVIWWRFTRARPIVSGLGGLLGLLVQGFILLVGISCAPGLFVGLVVGLAVLRHLVFPGEAIQRHTRAEITALCAASCWVLVSIHTLADPVLDQAAGVIGGASRLLGLGWPALVSFLAVAVAAVLARPGRWLLAVPIALVVAIPLERLGGAGLGWPGTVAATFPALALASRQIRRGIDPLASWDLRPNLLSAQLLPLTVVAAACVSYVYLFGAWNCGAVARAPEVEVLNSRPGAFAALPASDGSGVLVAYRNAREIAFLDAETGIPRALISTEHILEELGSRHSAELRPEVMLELPEEDAFVVLLVAPEPRVPSAILRVGRPNLVVTASRVGLDCDEATDVLLHADTGLLLVSCPYGSLSRGDSHPTLLMLEPDDLLAVGERQLQRVRPDRMIQASDGRLLGANIMFPRVSEFSLEEPDAVPVGDVDDVVLDMALTHAGDILLTEYLRGTVLSMSRGGTSTPTRRRVGYGTRALSCDTRDEPRCHASSAATGRLVVVAPERDDSTLPIGGHVRRLAHWPAHGTLVAAGDCGCVEASVR